jgi:energy-coupling factor transporter ATP-binding protein EcfA2
MSMNISEEIIPILDKNVEKHALKHKSMKDIVQIRNLEFSYGTSGQPAIRDIDLSIGEGEYVLIAGLSGCGKSTFCRCLNGLIPHFYRSGVMKGTVIVDGLDTQEHFLHEITQKVGMVFQDPESQLMALTVERDLAFGPENLGLPREEIRARVEEALELVNITHLRERAPHELSGGEQQRVAIASVLTLQPKILVLDEPTANLDPASAVDVLNAIEKLRVQKNITVIIVEHRLELALQSATRLLIMHDGVLVFDDTPANLIAKGSDLIEAYGVQMPSLIQLSVQLLEEGLSFSQIPFTISQAAALLLHKLKMTRSVSE